jgi:hypothetical protein
LPPNDPGCPSTAVRRRQAVIPGSFRRTITSALSQLDLRVDGSELAGALVPEVRA